MWLEDKAPGESCDKESRRMKALPPIGIFLGVAPEMCPRSGQ